MHNFCWWSKKEGGGGLILKNLSGGAVTETYSNNLELGTHLSTCLKAEEKQLNFTSV